MNSEVSNFIWRFYKDVWWKLSEKGSLVVNSGIYKGRCPNLKE